MRPQFVSLGSHRLSRETFALRLFRFCDCLLWYGTIDRQAPLRESFPPINYTLLCRKVTTRPVTFEDIMRIGRIFPISHIIIRIFVGAVLQ